MPSYRQPGFAAGELAPGMWGRTDLPLYETGLKRCHNFFVTDAGAASYRPGLERIAVFDRPAARITPYSFRTSSLSTDKVHRGLLIVLPRSFQVQLGTAPATMGSHPYTEADLPKLRFMPMGVRTLITCPGHPIREVSGYGADFALREFKTESPHAFRADLLLLPGRVPYYEFEFFNTLYDDAVEGDRSTTFRVRISAEYGAQAFYRERLIDTAGPPPGLENDFGPNARFRLRESRPDLVILTVRGRTYTYALHTHVVDGKRRLLFEWRNDIPDTGPVVEATYTDPGDDETPERMWGYAATELVEVEGALIESQPFQVGMPRKIKLSSRTPVELYVRYTGRPALKGYNVYRADLSRRTPTYGFVGTLPTAGRGEIFTDTGADADFTRSPPGADPIPKGDAIPTTAVLHQGRLFLAGSAEDPARLWASRVDSYQDFQVHEPLTSEDAALRLDLGVTEAENITDLVSLSDLLVFTDRAVWSLTGPNRSPLVAVGLNSADRNNFDGHRGTARAVPARSGVFYQTRNGLLYLRYEWEQRGYVTQNVAAVAGHLFEAEAQGPSRHVAWGRNPGPMLWAVRERGDFITLTFAPEAGVQGWAHHATAGKVLDVAVVQGEDHDQVYFIVQRSGRIHLERLFFKDFNSETHVPFLDGAVKYVSNSTVDREWVRLPHQQVRLPDFGTHLANQTVRVVSSDNTFISEPVRVAADGSITFTYRADLKASDVFWAGLPYEGELELLDMPMEKLRLRNVKRVAWEVSQGRGVWTGGFRDRMAEWRQRRMMDGYNAPPTATELADVYVESTWDLRGSAILQQRLPLPVTVVGVTREGQVSND